MASYRQRIYRGEVYFTTFPNTTGSEICGTHPVVIVQNDVGNYHSSVVIGVVLTHSIEKEYMPTHVILEEPGTECDGSMVVADQIFTIDKRRLRGYVGQLSAASMARINEVIKESLSLTNMEPELMCLCPRCRRAFAELPHQSVHRVDREQQTMDTCTFCSHGRGYDYWIHDWSGLLKAAIPEQMTPVQ